jgi:hypothetical protein
VSSFSAADLAGFYTALEFEKRCDPRFEVNHKIDSRIAASGSRSSQRKSVTFFARPF